MRDELLKLDQAKEKVLTSLTQNFDKIPRQSNTVSYTQEQLNGLQLASEMDISYAVVKELSDVRWVQNNKPDFYKEEVRKLTNLIVGQEKLAQKRAETYQRGIQKKTAEVKKQYELDLAILEKKNNFITAVGAGSFGAGAVRMSFSKEEKNRELEKLSQDKGIEKSTKDNLEQFKVFLNRCMGV